MSEYLKVESFIPDAIYDEVNYRVVKPSGDPLSYDELLKQCFYLKDTNIESGVLHGKLAELEANKSIMSEEEREEYYLLKKKFKFLGCLSKMAGDMANKGKIELADYKSFKNIVGHNSAFVNPPFGVHKDAESEI